MKITWSGMTWTQLQSEWRSNARLRIGLWLAVAILGIYASLALNDWRLRLHEEYHQASLRLYKMADLSGREEWLERAQHAADMRKALETQIPVVATSGMAQAEAQGAVKDLLSAFGRKMVSTPGTALQVDAANAIWKVPITVRGEITTSQLAAMLERVESNERLVVVENLSVDNRQRMTATLTISAYYRIRKPVPEAGS